MRTAAIGMGLAAISTLIAAAPAPAKQTISTVDLRPRFSVGREDRYIVVVDSDQDRDPTTEGGQPYKQTVHQEMRFLRRVAKLSDEGVVFEMVLEHARMTVEKNGESGEFDSDTPESADESNPLAPAIRRVIGLKTTLTLDPDAKVVQIEGNKCKEPGQPEYSPAFVGDEIFRRALMPVHHLPGAPGKARVGETWKWADKIPSPPVGTGALRCTYTLANVAGPLATVSVTGTITMSPAIGPSAIKGEITDSEIKGSYEWDCSAGVLRRSDLLQRMNLTADMGGRPVGLRSTSRVAITRDGGGPKPRAGRPVAGESRTENGRP